MFSKFIRISDNRVINYKKMPREKHSVHKHFTKSTVEGKNNKFTLKATCNFCKWISVNNTTRLIKHIKTCSKCPPEILKEISGQLEVNESNDDSDDSHTNNEGPVAKKAKPNQSIEGFITRDKSVTEVQRVSKNLIF